MIDRLDIEAIERLSDAAMRGGHTQTAIDGYALAMRLRASLGIWKVDDAWSTDERRKLEETHGP